MIGDHNIFGYRTLSELSVETRYIRTLSSPLVLDIFIPKYMYIRDGLSLRDQNSLLLSTLTVTITITVVIRVTVVTALSLPPDTFMPPNYRF